MIRFDPIPYPIWRRRLPSLVRAAAHPLLARFTAMSADEPPPLTAAGLAAYLTRWGLLDEDAAHTLTPEAAETATGAAPPPPVTGRVRLPAQWEPVEAVLLAWPVLYPALWPAHAQMVEAIAPAARVDILVPSALWGGAVRRYLTQRLAAAGAWTIRALPTDDIWIRDYGPIVGRDAAGRRAVVKPVFDPLPNYPQERDNTLPRRWAAAEGLPLVELDLHLEGGNLWSDGAGTLIVSEQIFFSNPGLDRAAIEARLRAALDFDKLLIAPRLAHEETGHVDLVIKLADARTVLVSAPHVPVNGWRLRAAAALFRSARSAAGEPYRVFELPAPPPYLNWLVYPIWRSYTNSLTVNGRVLVPVFGIGADKEALAVYRRALPDHTIIPVDCRYTVNGGGAVHCLTREIPA